MKPYTKPSQPSNVIYYTSSDGNIVTPHRTDAFGANIVSNNYKDGNGVITFDGDVTTIEYDAFLSCKSLTSVAIPNSVTKIEDYVFQGCINLTSVTIPDSVTHIGEMTFYNCYRLTSVTIPYGVTTIGYEAFSSCDSLTNVYCKATTPPSLDGTSVFSYNSSGRKFYVPATSVAAYKTATNWSAYANDIIGYDF